VVERGRRGTRWTAAGLGSLILLGASFAGLAGPAVAAGSLSAAPKSGPAGTIITLSGSGWTTTSSTVEILWAGVYAASGTIDKDGGLSASVEVPKDAKVGPNNITACAPSQTACLESAESTFTVTVEPTPSPSPDATPTPSPSAGSTATASPTVAPTATSAPTPTVAPTPGTTPIVPAWLPPGGGWPDSVPDVVLPRPGCEEDYRRLGGNLYDFEWTLGPVTSLSTITYINGTVARPLVATRSGDRALASPVDDFGSAGHPLTMVLGNPRRGVGMWVGRESPPLGAGALTATLVGYGVDGAGQAIEVARDEVILTAVPTPIRQCLRVIAPAGQGIWSVSLEYSESDGRSAYERRWIDDLLVGPDAVDDATRPRVSARIVAPADGAVIEADRGTPILVRVDLASVARPSGGAVRVGGATYHPTWQPAGDGDPSHWTVSFLARDVPVDVPVEIRVEGLDGARSSFMLRPPVSGNLAVTGIEPVQVTQTPSLGVPLLAWKPTAVRVYLQGSTDSRGAWRVSVASLTTRDVAGVSRTHLPVNVSLADGFSAPADGSHRDRNDDSLLFLLSPEETAPGLLEATVRVFGPASRPETSRTDNERSIRLRFVPASPLVVYAIIGQYPALPGGTWAELQGIARQAETMLPVRRLDIRPVPGQPTTAIDFANLGAMQLRAGLLLWSLPGDAHIFALRPDMTCPPGMERCEAGFASFSRTDGWRQPGHAPVVMAQELSHSYGLWWHAQTEWEWADGPYAFWNPEWPYWHTSIGQPGVVLRAGSPPAVMAGSGGAGHVHDYMSYAGPPFWASPFTYCDLGDRLNGPDPFCAPGTRSEASHGEPIGLVGSPFASSGVATGWSPGAPEARLAATRIAVGPDGPSTAGSPALQRWPLLVSGTIEPDGTLTLGRVEPVPAGPADTSGDLFGREYTIELIGADGTVLAQRGFIPVSSHPMPGDDPVVWQVPLADPGGVESIVVRHLGEVVATRSASPSAPTIELLAPTAGTTWDAGTPARIAWRATDVDGDPVTVSVAYSADGGTTWWPVAAAIEGGEVVLDASTLPGSAAGLLRIAASDGLRTTTLPGPGPITVPDHGPSVVIDGPPSGMTYRPGQPIAISATGFDAEADIADEAFGWSSDIAGDLGPGRWRVLESLGVGRHTLTVTVTDAAGQQASASVVVEIAGSDWNTAPEASGPAVSPPPAGGEGGAGTAQAALAAAAAAIAVGVALGLAAWLRRRRDRPSA
jgi:hypothetical protein